MSGARWVDPFTLGGLRAREDVAAIMPSARVVAALGRARLPDDEDVDMYLDNLRRMFADRSAYGPALAANIRPLLGALHPYPTPEGCGELLADLADKLPAQRPS